jgi:hypothetical protein
MTRVKPFPEPGAYEPYFNEFNPYPANVEYRVSS